MEVVAQSCSKWTVMGWRMVQGWGVGGVMGLPVQEASRSSHNRFFPRDFRGAQPAAPSISDFCLQNSEKINFGRPKAPSVWWAVLQP